MPSSRATEWNDASGRHAQLLRPDGSFKQWLNGAVVGEGGPDADRAEAFSAGTYDAVAESTRAGDAWLNSDSGRRVVAQEEQAGATAKLRGDQQYGLQKDQLGISRGTLDLNRENTRFDNDLARDQFGQTVTEQDRRFGLDERRFGLDERGQAAREAELDRRFGLDSAKFGVDFFQTAANYGKTPKSWLESVQFQSPRFMSNAVQGLQNPAFGARGATPQMNSITDSVAASSGGSGLNAGLMDPAANIKKILAGAPPSEGSGFTGQDIAAVRLIQEMYKNGGQNMKEGAWESYTPEQRDFVTGTMDWMSPNGGSDFQNQIARSRIPRAGSAFAA